jgi:hypothetical protein
VNYPQDFLLAGVSLDDIPALKVWGARFFLNQFRTLWALGVPASFPNRYVFVALVDAMVGEIISARDALRKELAKKMRSNGLKPWKREIFEAMNQAMGEGGWLAKVLDLRNRALHGSYLPENIRIGGTPSLDMRLVGYEHGIVADVPMPEDFSRVCDKMDELIQVSRNSVKAASDEKAKNSETSPADWFSMVDS